MTAQDTRTYRSEHARAGGERGDASIGQIITDISEDVSRLMRQEVELAKAEIREEAGKAGKAAGMLSLAGFAGIMTTVLLTLTGVFALANVMDLGWAALIATAVWAVVGLVAFTYGRKKLRGLSPVPHRTVETLKEDARWLRHPTG